MKILEKKLSRDGKTGMITVDRFPDDLTADSVCLLLEGAEDTVIALPPVPPHRMSREKSATAAEN